MDAISEIKSTGRRRERVPLTSEQQQLVVNNTRLAFKAAKKFRAPIGMSLEEWEAECLYALVLAAECFDPARGSFSTCVYYLVQWHRRDLIRQRQEEYKKKQRTRSLGNWIWSLGERYDFDKNMRAADLQEFNNQVIAQLPKQWQLILRGWLSGRTFEDMANERGVRKQAIVQTANRAIQMARGMALELKINPSWYRAD